MLEEFHKLILRHISQSGYRVSDVIYHTELIAISAPGVPYWIGSNRGIQPQHSYFFGSASIWTEFYTLTSLLQKNCLRTNFATTLMNAPATWTDLDIIQGVGLDMSLMGNGDYTGLRRAHNIGCNQILHSLLDFDAGATWMTMITLNGFLYVLI